MTIKMNKIFLRRILIFSYACMFLAGVSLVTQSSTLSYQHVIRVCGHWVECLFPFFFREALRRPFEAMDAW